jgi:rSAM/selenodomain-associated transferase 1
MTDRWLVVMARRPRAFAVKSRLAAEIGAAQAIRFYRTNLARLLRGVGRDPRWTTVLAVTPDTAVSDLALPGGIARIGQGPGDLGARMQRIMEAMPPGPVAIVGSDIPGVRPAHIEAAFRLLGRHDAVFGPAADGGYWLVGLKRRPRIPRIFAGVRWSSEHALADTLANCRGLPAAMAETLTDIDTGAAWRAWRKQA